MNLYRILIRIREFTQIEWPLYPRGREEERYIDYSDAGNLIIDMMQQRRTRVPECKA